MALPVVIIVGRPNVGKSTLFNRIVGGRKAIVDDQPGVTRDRKYMPAEWAGRHFTLVDTGGYLPESQDRIERAIVEQVNIAIKEADLIIFLLDAKTGVTSVDAEIGQLIQRSGKNVILTINKVDDSEKEQDIVDFYSLGLGEPVPLAAVSGRRVGDFLDAVLASLPERSGDNLVEPSISLAVIGRPNVGKSSFVNAILGHNKHIVTEIPGTTRDSIDTLFKYYGQDFLLIDTAGLRRRTKVTESIEFYSVLRSFESIQRCDVAILMIDATQGMEAQDMKVLQEAIRFNKGIILAVNKWDLIEKDSHTAIKFERDIKDRLKNVSYLPIIFISALTKQRVYKVIEIAKSVYEERSKNIKTAVLNKFLEEITAKYSPPSMDRKEVKLNYCTQIKTNPPVFAFFTNAPKSIKPNYRSYIENQLRQRFGFFGVPVTLTFSKKR
jgi:GTP-binding protein